MKGVKHMARKDVMSKISVYLPQGKLKDKIVERLIKLGAEKDRSVNYLVIAAIEQYLERAEVKE